VINIKWYYS